jgi:probable HAF family extracellular repeat protein
MAAPRERNIARAKREPFPTPEEDGMAPLASRIAIFLFTFAAFAAFADSSKAWTITQLPTLGAGGDAMAVNNRGDIVGDSVVFDSAANTFRLRTTRWRAGVPEDLGNGEAFDVNEHGTIAGTHFPGGEALFRDGVWTQLGVGTPGFPLFVNDHDVVASSFPFIGVQHAYTFRDGVVTDLGTLGGTESQSSAINDRGDVVGFSRTAGDASIHPFLYRDGVMRDLGTLGRAQGHAVDVNNHGVVVGYVSDVFDGFPVAFIFDRTMRTLLPGGPCCMFPSAINDRGDVVGSIDGLGAFLLEDGKLTRLDQLPAVKATWRQILPTDINDRGWIVGRGILNRPLAPGEWPFKPFLLRRNGD